MTWEEFLARLQELESWAGKEEKPEATWWLLLHQWAEKKLNAAYEKQFGGGGSGSGSGN